MAVTKNTPVFNKRLFWDVDVSKLDFDKNERFVVERVFERGDVEDIRACRRYYGDALIEGILLNAQSISTQRLYLISAIYNKPLSAFRCYTLKQLNPTRYPY